MALLDVDDWSVENWQSLIACEHCGTHDVGVYPAHIGLYPALTAYVDQDLNRPLYMCPPCSEEYYDYYKEKWLEARS